MQKTSVLHFTPIPALPAWNKGDILRYELGDKISMIVHAYSFCGEPIESPDDVAEQETKRSNCKEIAFVSYEGDGYKGSKCEEDGVGKNQDLLFDSGPKHPADLFGPEPHRRREGWFMNLVAVVVGIVAGLLLLDLMRSW